MIRIKNPEESFKKSYVTASLIMVFLTLFSVFSVFYFVSIQQHNNKIHLLIINQRGKIQKIVKTVFQLNSDSDKQKISVNLSELRILDSTWISAQNQLLNEEINSVDSSGIEARNLIDQSNKSFRKIHTSIESIVSDFEENNIDKEFQTILANEQTYFRLINEASVIYDDVEKNSYNRILVLTAILGFIFIIAILFQTIFVFRPASIKIRESFAELENREAILRSFVEHSPAAIAMTDLQFRLIAVSKKWFEDHHINTPVIGKHYDEVFTDQENDWRRIQLRALTGETIKNEEQQISNSDGSSAWISWEVKPWFKGDQSIGGVLMLTQNITTRKLLDKELKDVNHLLQTILNATDYSIISTDPNGTVRIFNKGAEDMLGYSADEIVGKATPEIFHLNEEIEKRAIDLSAETKTPIQPGPDVFTIRAKQGKTDVNEWTYIHKNKNRIPVLLAISSLRDSENNIIGYLGIARDISDQKRTQLKLIESESKYRKIIDEAGDILYLSDGDGKFLFINNRVSEVIGFSSGELVGKHFSVLVAQEWREKVIDYYKKQFLEKIRESTFQFPVITKSGEKKWVEQVVVAQFEGDSVKGYQCIVRDIQTRKMIEEELIRAKSFAEEAKKTQEIFLANTSHEIRTPMNGVIGMTNLLLETNLSKEQLEFVEAIKESASSLLVIINDILDISKIQAGKITIEQESFSIGEIIKNVMLNLQYKSMEKQILFSSDIDDSIPPSVIGDQTRLSQILLNLCGNAIKFTEKGSVKISASVKHISGSEIEILFKIFDTGIGIPKDKLNLIFESFTQASSDTTRKYGGTGLGLSISKQLIELQNGTLSVSSEENIGSEFTFILPYQTDSEIRKSPVNKTKPDQKTQFVNLKVLVVEDNFINQKVIVKTLHKWGASSSTAENGKISLDILSKEKFDLILMDLQMPEMDGLETTIQIRKSKEDWLKKIPIIAMTASAFKSEKEKCMKAGMNDYITKPFDPKDLFERILHLVRPN